MQEELLGKRHDYITNPVPEMEEQAKKLGFSRSEIEELKKLYGDEMIETMEVDSHKAEKK